MCKFITDILWTYFGCEKFLQTGFYEKFINDFVFVHTARIMVAKNKKSKVAVGFWNSGIETNPRYITLRAYCRGTNGDYGCEEKIPQGLTSES